MQIVIAHNAVGEHDSAAAQDVLAQRDVVATALQRRGHRCVSVACTLDLATFVGELRRHGAQLVFNLVESLLQTDQLAHLVPAVLDAIDLPYSGNSAAALLATNDKLETKRRLLSAGLPTPSWIAARPTREPRQLVPGVYVLKCVGEHASLGIDDGALVEPRDLGELQQAIAARSRALGRLCFAERFVDGRELNISLLEDRGGVRVLPAAEIDFSAFPPDKPRIVGYAAKWDAEAFEYQQTPRRFDFPAADGPLLAEVERLCQRCWEVFGLSGYARVDFRVDAAGQPWILEINANPGLSPDAGFAAAVAQAGLGLDEAIEQIVAAAAGPLVEASCDG